MLYGIVIVSVAAAHVRLVGSTLKHDHNPFLIAFYIRCFSKQFRDLLDFIFDNYKGNYMNAATMNHTVSRTKP